MSETQRQFAYGKDTIEDCACPAVAAGYSPGSGDVSTRVAEEYDDMVRTWGYANADSTLSEERAKKCWLAALERLENRGLYGQDVARDIAEELDWI